MHKNEAQRLLEVYDNPTVFYHGTTSQFNRFDPEFTGKGHDLEGPGFYFTNSEQDARAYSYPNGHVMVVRLNLRKTVPPKGGVTPQVKQQAMQLLKAAPDLEDTLTNWGEDPRKALQGYYNEVVSRPDALDLFTQIWYDFYRYSAAQWLAGMVSLGYDGVILSRNDGVIHAVVYNPDAIEIVEVKAVQSE